MSAPWESPIIRITTGLLNTVNDTVIGGGPSIGSRSRYQGQLGKHVWFGPEQINQMFSSSVGTLFPGRFRYVRIRSGDDASPVPAVGKLYFWDTTLTNWQTLFQVTRDENLSSQNNAIMFAGVYIGGPQNGNYGFIQDAGMVNIRFRSVLTAAADTTGGSRIYCAGAGDVGADQGTADILTTDSTSIANARYLGRAVGVPVAGQLAQVLLDESRFGVI